MKTFWKYLKEVHSKESEASAKRFYGAITIMVTLIMICIFRHDDLYNTFLAGCGLLGLGIIEKFKK